MASSATSSLGASVEARLRSLREAPCKSQRFTMFRVPAYVRESNRAAYEPRVVSIGPYYHGSPGLRAMEDHKWRYLLLMESEFGLSSAAALVEEMRSLEPRARACYSEPPPTHLGSDDFARMLLLDACFTIMFFLHGSDPDVLLDVSWARTLVNADLLLLENQIPFFVLEKLAKILLTNSNRSNCGSSYYESLFGKREFLMNMLLAGDEEPVAWPRASWEIHHLLHLYYQRFVPVWAADGDDRGTPKEEAPSSCSPSASSSPGRRRLRRSPSNDDDTVPVGIEQPKEEEEEADDYDMFVQAAPVPVGIEQPKEEEEAVTIDDYDCAFDDMDMQASSSVAVYIPAPKEMTAAATTIDDYDPGVFGIAMQAPSVAVHIRQPKQDKAARTRGIPCAREMSAAGITIVRPKEKRNKYGVTFDRRRGVMEVPAILVDDMTQRRLLVNLIAFEQTMGKGSRDRVVTSYVTLMSMLIRREDDVELLRRAEVLDNLLADDGEAARFFSHLGDCVAMDYDDQPFAQLYKDVQVYCRSWRHRNRAVLMRDYFGSPWSAIAVVAAAVVFVLTATQTYFTIFPAKG